MDDYGNKWSLSALLRHLKLAGEDTTRLMQVGMRAGGGWAVDSEMIDGWIVKRVVSEGISAK